jgi:hypothetical protein
MVGAVDIVAVCLLPTIDSLPYHRYPSPVGERLID